MKINLIKNISKITFGCEPLGGIDWGEVDLFKIEEAIHQALDFGINSFDTAQVYGLGLSESRLSKILGSKRQDLFIATKGGFEWEINNKHFKDRVSVSRNCSIDKIRNGIEDSLRRLRLNTIPLYYIHWPDPNTPIKETYDFLMKMKKSGKIQNIGCSNFNGSQISQACEVSEISYVQIPLNIIDSGLYKDISKICEEKKIKIVAYNVLANGLLTGKFDSNTKFESNDRRSRMSLFNGEEFNQALGKVSKIKSDALVLNKTIAQFSIDWVLKQENIASAIVGIKNKMQLIENYNY